MGDVGDRLASLALFRGKDVRDDTTRRTGLFSLASNTFGLSFGEWHRQGYWGDQYIPYTLFDGDRAVANVSANIINTEYNGIPKRCIQLGTVMVDCQYRGRGLAKSLMKTVLEDWVFRCDAVYLYANDEAAAFYPQFGFIEEKEYCFRRPLSPSSGTSRRLDITDVSDIELIRRAYNKGNPHSAMLMLDNWGLLMFHLMTDLRDSVYFDEGLGAIVIAEDTDDSLICYDMYCDENLPPEEVLGVIDSAGCSDIQYGFALKDPPVGSLSCLAEKDSTLFVLEGKEDIFAKRKTMMPLLSRA